MCAAQEAATGKLYYNLLLPKYDLGKGALIPGGTQVSWPGPSASLSFLVSKTSHLILLNPVHTLCYMILYHVSFPFLSYHFHHFIFSARPVYPACPILS